MNRNPMNVRQGVVICIVFLVVISLLAPPVGYASNDVSKEQLVAKIKELFPGKFDHLRDNDFQMERFGPSRSIDTEPRYDIYVSKQLDGEYMGANFTFSEKQELISYSYSPARNTDATFPPKVNREEALEIATDFLHTVSAVADSYQVVEDNGSIYYYGYTRPLTEPVRYEFSFERKVNGIPVPASRIHLTVLGNGEVAGYNKGLADGEYTFESAEDLLSVEEIKQKLEQDLEPQLFYWVDYDYRTNESNVHLVYHPIEPYSWIHAKDGKWHRNGEFLESLPKINEIRMLVDEPLQSQSKIRTKEQAKEFALKLLDPQDDSVTLEIHGVDEYVNPFGRSVYTISYMFYSGNSGTGSSFEIDKVTGEISTFSGYRGAYSFGAEEKEPAITYDEALQLAVEYLKEYAPSTLHQLAYPHTEDRAWYGSYSFSFPRVENGIPFRSEGIQVSVSSETGQLVALHNRRFELDDLPSPDDVVEADVAKKAFLEAANIELQYVQLAQEDSSSQNHFHAVYTIDFGSYTQIFNALTGEWETTADYLRVDRNTPHLNITHDWAEEELNFLINSRILTVGQEEEFNPDVSVTKGQAIEIIVKSLGRYWDQYVPYRNEEVKQTYKNIDATHPLFGIVERAVELNILDGQQETVNLDEKVTRQELASLFIRTLQLNEVASYSTIYTLDFKDAHKVATDYRGHVALASAIGLLTPNNGYFHPEQEVSLAQLAVATFRLAEATNKFN